MKNWIITFACLTILATSLTAQRDETIFDGLSLTGAWGGPMVNLTKFGEDFTLMRGGFGGLEFNKTMFIGWGGLDTRERVTIDGRDEFDLDFNGIILGATPQAFKSLHPKIMLMTGGGDLNVIGEGDDNIWVIQPSAGVEINVFRWFRFGAEAGYRFVTDTDVPGISDGDVSAFFGQLTFRFGYSWGR